MSGVPASWWVSTVAVPLVLLVALWLYHRYWLRPQAMIDRFRRQGIPGCDFRPFVGNIPDIQEMKRAAAKERPSVKMAIPFLEMMEKKFGATYTYCFGSTPRLVTSDPALIRQIYVAKNDDFPKIEAGEGFRLLGNGLSSSSGELWERQRGMIAPIFKKENIKHLVEAVGVCAQDAVSSWVDRMTLERSVVLDMDKELSRLSLEAIGRATFGADISGMREVSREAVRVLGRYFDLVPTWLANGGQFPFYRWLPTAMNRQLMDDEATIKRLLLGLISRRRSAQESRLVEASYGATSEPSSPDLLEFMLEAKDESFPNDSNTTSKSKTKEVGIEGGRMTDQQLMFECITMVVAGHETVAGTLMWAMFLMAKHPEWQEKSREEVLRVCRKEDCDGKEGGPLPTLEQLEALKNLDMVVLECLRIYPPATVLARKCGRDASLVGLRVKKGAEIVLPLIQIHRKRDVWGPDADDFRPERFADGLGGAVKHPMAYLPFSTGPRSCVGQSFAMAEVKMILALILQSFKWTMAPNYRHCPSTALTLKPKFGMPMVVERLLL